MNKAGNKVLILDFNDQDSEYNSFFKLENKKGIINLLENSSVSSKDLIQEIPSMKNVSLITKGSYEKSSQHIFSSDIKKIINKVKKENKFDFIFLMDSNLSGSSRSLELQKSVQGLILQIKLGVNKKLVVENLLEKLVINGSNLIGIVTKEK